MAEEDLDWDADDFDPEAGFAKDGDKWEGEDEELLKEIQKEEEQEGKEAPPTDKSKKSKAERIEEKKAERRSKEQKAQEEKEQSKKPLTAEEEHEEKMRLLQLQKDSDLQLAKELLGGGTTAGGIDAMAPSSREDFTQFEGAISKKILQFQNSPHFVTFLDSLLRSTCAGLEAEDLRQLSSTLSTLAQEKQKMAKTAKTKKKGTKSLNTSKAGRKQLGAGLGDEFDDYSVADVGGKQLMVDDDDDFI